MIGFTCFWKFSAKHLLCSQLPCHIPSLYELLQSTSEAFKVNAHLQSYLMSFRFHCLAIHCNTVLSSMAKPFKQLIIHIAMHYSMNPHAF
jgi:hypothetical protein